MGEVIKYVGTADNRQILKSEWAGAGVKDQDTVVWHRGNGWTVPVDKVNEEARTFIEADDGFVIVDSDAKSKKGDRPVEVEVPIQGYPGGTPVVPESGGMVASAPVTSSTSAGTRLR